MLCSEINARTYEKATENFFSNVKNQIDAILEGI